MTITRRAFGAIAALALLAAPLAAQDLKGVTLRVADQVGASTFRYMEMFLMVGLIYWVINQILTIVQTIFEGRVSRRFQ